MDLATQRTQAYALIDALPQDCLELVVLLLRKLASNGQTSQGDKPLHTVEQSKEEAIAELRSLCHPGKHVCSDEHSAHVAMLSQFKGIGGRSWEEDPQAYVSALRSEEREL